MKYPNILYIMPDEWRLRALGYRQEDPVYTPNVDQLASESVQLENAISNYPVCTPHRGMLFTGQYPCSARVTGNSNSSTAPWFVRLPKHRVTLSDHLHNEGYYCAYVGKWHLDSPELSDIEHLEPRRSDGKVWDAFTPEDRRHHFSYWFSYGCNDNHYMPHYWDNTNDVSARTEFPGRWSTEVEAERVIDFIRNTNDIRPKDQPFYMVWAPNPPHMPFEQHPEAFAKYYEGKDWEDLLVAESYRALDGPKAELSPAMQREFEANIETARREVKDYFISITAVDYYIGQVLAVLEETGLKDDTLVIFCSDHGDLMGSHGLIRKGPWFDESVKIPYLMRWPGVLTPSKRTFLLNTPDIFPTLANLVGLGENLPDTIEGNDLSRFILDRSAEETISYQDEEGGLAYFINTQMNARGVRSTKYYLVVERNAYDEERYILYDLEEDPQMLVDVSRDSPEVVREYRGLLENWMQRCEDWWLL